MATKDMSRTVIEGGRADGNKWDRYASNQHHRAQIRAFCDETKSLIDPDEAKVQPKRKKINKNFQDKLGPAYRWLRSNIGQKWDAVFSRLCNQFDTRTVAGRHIVHDHMLRDITMMGKISIYGDDFFVDQDGILQLSDTNRWNRRNRNRNKNNVSTKELIKWVDGRKVMDYGVSIFWMVSERIEWAECGSYSPYGYWSAGYYCSQGEHKASTKLVGVAEPYKLLAFEKAILTKKIIDGQEVYYREKKIKMCRQSKGNYFQGPRFSQDDLKMWFRLSENDRESLLHPTRVRPRSGRP